jgi:hypothetical protein
LRKNLEKPSIADRKAKRLAGAIRNIVYRAISGGNYTRENNLYQRSKLFQTTGYPVKIVRKKVKRTRSFQNTAKMDLLIQKMNEQRIGNSSSEIPKFCASLAEY